MRGQPLSTMISRRWSRQSHSNRRPADYKSAALPAEICRLLRGEILSPAASANRFLYAFSIRQDLTLLIKELHWIRSERTRGYSHRFRPSAMGDPLRTWSRSHACSGHAEQLQRV